ncbi:sensor histidine kinase [Hymenobacter guriensis]|uniref:sensor histidine kinase n=1 Tax=Hymenobacter guriensis TaxID=2793065 RepID=UPI001E397773|nr:sensor histidine kinase [Hymenobacter guriensis]
MKKLSILFVLIALLATQRAAAQQPSVRADSLQRLLARSGPDTSRVQLLIQLAWDRTDDNPLAAIEYGRKSLTLARQLKFRPGECRALLMLGWAFLRSGNYPTAVQSHLQARKLAEAIHYRGGLVHADNGLGYAHLEQGNYVLALRYFFRATNLAQQIPDSVLLAPIPGNIGYAYLQTNQLDSARYYTLWGYELDKRLHDQHSEIGDLSILGDIEARQNPAAATAYYQQSIARAQGMPVSYALCRSYLGLARLARARSQATDAVRYARQALQASKQGRYTKGVMEASAYLADIYAHQGNTPQAYQFLVAANATRDTLFGQAKLMQVQALNFSEQLRHLELAEQHQRAAVEQRQRLLQAALGGVVLVAGIGYLLIGRRHLRREVEFAQERQRLVRQRAVAVLEGEEKERQRVGAELHDGVGQLLSATRMNLLALEHRLALTNPVHQELLTNALHGLDESVKEVRSISHNLLPANLLKAGLVPAVKNLLVNIARIDSRLQVRMQVFGVEHGRLDVLVEAVLFRAIQEAVQNILKHAQATEIHVQLVQTEQDLTVMVEDNGVGYDTEGRKSAAGLGLQNMRSRLAYLGGQAEFDASPNRGTIVTLVVPVPANALAAHAASLPVNRPASGVA